MPAPGAGRAARDDNNDVALDAGDLVLDSLRGGLISSPKLRDHTRHAGYNAQHGKYPAKIVHRQRPERDAYGLTLVSLL
jgi:hypothetical protein